MTLTLFFVALAAMIGVGGAVFATVVLGYDVLFNEYHGPERLTVASIQIGVGYLISIACAGLISVIGPSLCRGCP